MTALRTRSLLVLPLLLAAAVVMRAAPRHAAPAAVTFSADVAPILYSNCVTCHRPGEAAPFSLISYEDARKHGSQMARVTASRYMPPWHAAHGYGEFADERRLTDEQITVLGNWVKAGMPEGDPKRLPAPPQFPSGWHLGTPDLILKMPAAYDLPASGADVYRNFVIPTHLTEDKWVRAIEFRPAARKAVHHVLFAYDTSGAGEKMDGQDGKPGFSGMGTAGVNGGAGSTGPLGGWAVGATPTFLPDGVAMALPKGSDIILQMHFHLTGKPETEQATIGIYFADKAPERKLYGLQVPALFGFGADIDIAAGDRTFVIQDAMTLPVDVRAFSVTAHAHYVAREMKADAILPDGTRQALIWIPDWDFNWQDRYMYKSPVLLPKGTRIEARLTYDNSDDNPRNPSIPPKRVQWGEQSLDEMGSVILAVQCVRAEDEPVLQRALGLRTRAAIQAAQQNGTLQRYLAEKAFLRRGGQ